MTGGDGRTASAVAATTVKAEDDGTPMLDNETALGALLRVRGDLPPTNPASNPSLRVPSTPSTVVWGHIPSERAAIATVAEGVPFRLDTVSHRGLVEGTDPVSFFAAHDVPAVEVLADMVTLFIDLVRVDGADGHLLTGPVGVLGAGPGDALEVFVHAADLRASHGVNASRPGQGLLPDLLSAASVRVLRTSADGTCVNFAPGVSVPVAPFPGFLAVAPAQEFGTVGSRVPGPWGGNLDFRWLTAGSSIIVPVFRPNALLYVGDPHAAQGHGEVNGTAVEQSVSFVLETRIHRGLAPSAPVVLTPDAVVCLGVAGELRTALRAALRSAIAVAIGWTDGALDVPGAYALCSIAGDAGVAEVVNGADVAYVSLPRDVLGSGRP